MSKFTFVFLIVVIAVVVQGFPTHPDDVSAAAAAGNWDKVHEILSRNLKAMYNWDPFKADVRSLKPTDGGHVFAESDFSFQTSSNKNGHVSSQSGGHKVINNDGTVSEFDYKPQ